MRPEHRRARAWPFSAAWFPSAASLEVIVVPEANLFRPGYVHDLRKQYDPAMTQPPAATPDFEAIKKKQQATWASGDYAVIGTTLQIVGEALCEAVDMRAGERVLDVAAGNGNATLAAARRWLPT